jgi:hypothetical protein
MMMMYRLVYTELDRCVSRTEYLYILEILVELRKQTRNAQVRLPMSTCFFHTITTPMCWRDVNWQVVDLIAGCWSHVALSKSIQS